VPLWFVKSGAARPVVALRRFRIPVPARVRVEDGAPVRVAIDRRGFSGGRVETAAGPWRTSGAWWRQDSWERDEWDATLSDGTTYRLLIEVLSAGRCKALSLVRARHLRWSVQNAIDGWCTGPRQVLAPTNDRSRTGHRPIAGTGE
jgi:hypothetical protein